MWKGLLLALIAACSYSSPLPVLDASPPPVVAFEFPTSGIDEGVSGSTGSTAMIPVVLSKPSDSTITVECTAIPGGTASEQIDFVVVTHTVTFPPGTTRVEVEVDVFKDTNEMEPAEVIPLALSSPTGATLNAEKAIHEITIADHILPRISFTTDSSTTDEGTPTMLVLRLDIPADGPSTVVMGVTPTTTDVEDLTLAEGTVIPIPDGALSVLVPVGEVNDQLDELDTENVTFELKGASSNLVVDAAKKTRAHAITDDDDPPTVQFKVATNSVAEGIGTATIEVELTAESGLPVTVGYARNAADSALDNDATVTGSSLTFTPRTAGVPGVKSLLINVTIVDDASDETDEDVIVNLSANPSNASLGQATHTLTILADATDPPAVVEWDQPSSNRTENNQTQSITINITPASGKTITLPYTINASSTAENGSGNGHDDYDINTTSPMTIPPNTATFTFQIDVNEDSSNENNETVVLDLGTPQNATLGPEDRHTFTINDDD